MRNRSPLVALVFMSALAAAGLAEIELPACLPVTHPVVIDGSLGDWQDVEGKCFVPLRAVNTVSMAENRADLGATLRFAYDTEALYASAEWLSPTPPSNTTAPGNATGWQQGGDGLELHVALGGLVAHIASFPVDGGKKATLLIRREGENAWRDLTVDGGAAAVAARAKGYGQELRIPWRAITRNGRAPVGKSLLLMVDLAWTALPTAALAKLGEEMRIASTHFTFNVLNNRNRLLSRNYLSSPADWGELVFADAPAGARREDTPLGSGVIMLTVGKPVTVPTIDGVLTEGEWPVDALCDQAYAADFLGDRYALRLGLLSDSADLYVAARFKTPAKPLNLQPENTQQGFRGGDCLQIRLARDKRVVNLCAWYDSARDKLALTADGNDLPHPLLLAHGAKGAVGFGKGDYTIELAIPWKELFPEPAVPVAAEAPRAGERMRATFQPWWSGIDPRFTLTSRLLIEQRSPLAFTYTMPCDAEVTLGLYGKDGALLRWLTRAEFRRAGKNTEYWDGRDQDGRPLPAGEYDIKALYHDSLGLEHKLSVGNPGTPPWSTPDGKGDWIGDESNVQAATTDGDWVWLASPCSEKGFSIIGVDGAGQRRWGVANELQPRCVSLAVQGDCLYAVYCGPEKTNNEHRFTGKNAENRAILRCYDKRTGVPARFTRTKPSLKIAAWPYVENLVGLWEFFNNRSFDPDTYGGLPRYGDCQFGEAAEVLGIAATASTVYVSFHTQNRIRA
ncbi:MAG: hypothetical protein NTW87_32060, partial [Planctomycetota bacterium]|nr:hypothetical protein [Planctomycetota bacterium]